ncbi:MAG: hypothetical protein AB8G96_09370 [Phycisphaerales bacterium]
MSRPRDENPSDRSRDDQRRIVHVGPSEEARPGAPLDDQPSYLIEEARERLRKDDDHNKEASAVARRLVIAFVAVAILAVVFHVVMPAFGLALPPVVPLMCYAVIAAAAILTLRDE